MPNSVVFACDAAGPWAGEGLGDTALEGGYAEGAGARPPAADEISARAMDWQTALF